MICIWFFFVQCVSANLGLFRSSGCKMSVDLALNFVLSDQAIGSAHNFVENVYKRDFAYALTFAGFNSIRMLTSIHNCNGVVTHNPDNCSRVLSGNFASFNTTRVLVYGNHIADYYSKLETLTECRSHSLGSSLRIMKSPDTDWKPILTEEELRNDATVPLRIVVTITDLPPFIHGDTVKTCQTQGAPVRDTSGDSLTSGENVPYPSTHDLANVLEDGHFYLANFYVQREDFPKSAHSNAVRNILLNFLDGGIPANRPDVVHTGSLVVNLPVNPEAVPNAVQYVFESNAPELIGSKRITYDSAPYSYDQTFTKMMNRITQAGLNECQLAKEAKIKIITPEEETKPGLKDEEVKHVEEMAEEPEENNQNNTRKVVGATAGVSVGVLLLVGGAVYVAKKFTKPNAEEGAEFLATSHSVSTSDPTVSRDTERRAEVEDFFC